MYTFANIIMMCIFKADVNNWVDDNFEDYASYVKVKTTAAFAFHIIFCILIILALAFDKFVLCHPENRAKLAAIIQKITNKELGEATVCSACGQKVAPNARFCGSCGAAVEKPVAAEELVVAAESDVAPTEKTLLRTKLTNATLIK